MACRQEQSAEYPRQGETAAALAFMWKLCKTITFLGSIKNLRDSALSYKEACVSPLSRSCTIRYDSINQQWTNHANPSTQPVKRTILTAIWDTWGFHLPMAETSIWRGRRKARCGGLIKCDGLIRNGKDRRAVVGDSWVEKDLLLFLCATIFPV